MAGRNKNKNNNIQEIIEKHNWGLVSGERR